MLASKILMVRPTKFGYNEETSTSNTFQKQTKDPAHIIQANALNEFNSFSSKLITAGIDVVMFNDPSNTNSPDSIFPNNWFSTHPDGTFITYPMEAKNRRLERRTNILEFLEKKYPSRVKLESNEKASKFLEGTGSVLFDHEKKRMYVALSSRAHKDLALKLAKDLGFEAITFNTKDKTGKPIYHTNVMMSLGEQFAVVCKEVVDSNDYKNLEKALKEDQKEIIEITEEQMDAFSGNMMQLCNSEEERILVISITSFKSLKQEQIHKLKQYNSKIIVGIVPTIEAVGGGSVRCMIAELY